MRSFPKMISEILTDKQQSYYFLKQHNLRTLKVSVSTVNSGFPALFPLPPLPPAPPALALAPRNII